MARKRQSPESNRLRAPEGFAGLAPHRVNADGGLIGAGLGGAGRIVSAPVPSPAAALHRQGSAPPAGTRIVSVVNGKGGVGKTTIASNLAVYLRTVDSQLPVLVLGLDDASGPDEMFALPGAAPEETVHTALRRGCFDSAIRPGRYGVYYVPSTPRISETVRALTDPFMLRRALRRTGFPGVVIIDTKSDFGILTQNAIAASDLSVVPVADLASLLTAERVFDLLAGWGRPRTRARVVLSMLDLRIKYQAGLCRDVLGLLVGAARQLDFPLFQTFVARSPRVQALATNPEGRTYSILNEANRTNVHHQMGELAEELLDALQSPTATLSEVPRNHAPIEPARESDGPLAWLRPLTPAATFAVRQDGEKPLRIDHFPFFIGRDDPGVLNDLPIQDLRPWQVSRRHAHFIRREGRIGVMDLGSTLGTWVQDRQLGGPTADPGPVFFGPQGGELILGKRKSPYAFQVMLGSPAAARSDQASAPESPLRAAALAALAACRSL